MRQNSRANRADATAENDAAEKLSHHFPGCRLPENQTEYRRKTARNQTDPNQSQPAIHLEIGLDAVLLGHSHFHCRPPICRQLLASVAASAAQGRLFVSAARQILLRLIFMPGTFPYGEQRLKSGVRIGLAVHSVVPIGQAE